VAIAAIELREPAKDVVRAHRPGDPVEWGARSVVWDTRDGLAYVAVLSVSDETLLGWEPRPGRQPNATVDEWHECDAAMRAHPDVVAALAGRGRDRDRAAPRSGPTTRTVSRSSSATSR
jgi:primary-amine oxidase